MKTKLPKTSKIDPTKPLKVSKVFEYCTASTHEKGSVKGNVAYWAGRNKDEKVNKNRIIYPCEECLSTYLDFGYIPVYKHSDGQWYSVPESGDSFILKYDLTKMEWPSIKGKEVSVKDIKKQCPNDKHKGELVNGIHPVYNTHTSNVLWICDDHYQEYIKYNDWFKDLYYNSVSNKYYLNEIGTIKSDMKREVKVNEVKTNCVYYAPVSLGRHSKAYMPYMGKIETQVLDMPKKSKVSKDKQINIDVKMYHMIYTERYNNYNFLTIAADKDEAKEKILKHITNHLGWYIDKTEVLFINKTDYDVFQFMS